jgi:hypothetical protein
MYISMRDSAAAGFKKWSVARPSLIPADSASDEFASAIGLGEDAIRSVAESPRGPWLVPGPGTL